MLIIIFLTKSLSLYFFYRERVIGARDGELLNVLKSLEARKEVKKENILSMMVLGEGESGKKGIKKLRFIFFIYYFIYYFIYFFFFFRKNNPSPNTFWIKIKKI